MNAGALLKWFEDDPLTQRNAQGVVDPAYSFGGHAASDDVIDDGVNRAQQLDLQAAAGFPRFSFTPADFAIDIGEIVPAAIVGEDFPGELGAGLGDDCVSKTKHNETGHFLIENLLKERYT